MGVGFTIEVYGKMTFCEKHYPFYYYMYKLNETCLDCCPPCLDVHSSLKMFKMTDVAMKTVLV